MAIDDRLERFLNPANIGAVAEPSFTGRSASFECGALVQISLRVDESQRITEAKVRAAGCSALVAAASYLTETILGETSGDAASVGQRHELIAQQLGTTRTDCAALACAALEAAIAQYSDLKRDTWEGDDPLICTCFGVSERTIEREIQDKHLKTIEGVTAACNAGAGCRSCYPLIEDILSSVNVK